MKKEADLIRKKLNYLSSLNEFDARHYLALWAIESGWGGISEVSKLTGKSMNTIRKGIYEIETKNNLDLKETGRLRKEGGGRKKIVDKNPDVKKEIENILEENTAGDPMSKLKWTNKSTYTIADELKNKNHNASEVTVGRIIKRQITKKVLWKSVLETLFIGGAAAAISYYIGYFLRVLVGF